MTLDAKARATALKLLNKFGKTCILKSKAEGVYDPATGAVASVVTLHTIKAYLDAPNKAELQAGQVLNEDDVAIFAALGLPVTPGVNDLITVDGSDRLVKVVGRVWSGELVALYRVGLQS